MFLKRNKAVVASVWLAAALLITAGLTLHTFGSRGGGVIAETSAPTFSTLAETTVIPDGTYSTIPGETTQLPEPETQGNANGAREAKGNSALKTVSVILLSVGAAFSALYLFVFSAQRPVFGADISLLLLFVSAALMAVSRNASMALRIPLTLCGTALDLALLREFWGWILHGAPLNWSAAHRLGLAVSSGRWSRYMVFELIWALVSAGCFGACACIILRHSAYLLIPLSIIFAFLFAVSLALLLRLCRDTEHLTAQIERLHRGDVAEPASGVFEAAERRLIDMRRQRDEAVRSAVADERFKVELISNVSHDLRTPLTSILGYGELLTHENLSRQGQAQLGRLNQKAGYMRELVDELFELTKVSSGAAEAKRERLDLIRLLEQTLGLFDDRLAGAGLTVKRHYAQENIPIISDGARLHQVFANLIGNAVKYSMPGTRIHIEVRADKDCYTVRITNIASYEMDFSPEEVMQRFYRGDKARSTEGSGLGLAIAKTYSESVGGRFGIEIDGEQFSAVVTIPKTPLPES